MDTFHAIQYIASRLNKDKVINWNNFGQYKYYFYYDVVDSRFYQTCTRNDKIVGVIYCLDKNFLNTVIDTVGIEKLREYYKNS